MTELTAEALAAQEQARLTNGTFGVQVHTRPDCGPMDGAGSWTAPVYTTSVMWAPEDDDEWAEQVKQNLEAFGPHRAAGDGPYENSIEVTDMDGARFVIMSRDAAVESLMNDFDEGETCDRVPNRILSEATGMPEHVFETIRADDDDPAGSILNIVEQTMGSSATFDLATKMVAHPVSASVYFADGDPGDGNPYRQLSDSVTAYQMR